MSDFTHLNKKGEAVMVDVGEKNETKRTARARAVIKMKEATLEKLLSSDLKKGDGLSVSRIAGIMASKRTSELIPLCHNIPIEKAEITFNKISETELSVESFLSCSYKTGIEMEALTAVTVASLTVYDMCKAIDREMEITSVRLIEKTGGKSDFKND